MGCRLAATFSRQHGAGARLGQIRRGRAAHDVAHELAARIAPVPLLVVHGDADHYFPVEHAEHLFAAAGEPKELWLEPGFGHAENERGWSNRLPSSWVFSSWSRCQPGRRYGA